MFEKAIAEPKFPWIYAKLSKELEFISISECESAGEIRKNKITFGLKLVQQCQKEFKRHREESIVFNNIEEKLREIESLPGNEKRDEEKARLEEEHYRVRQRANGTVKFIGELFKIEILTTNVMEVCIEELLQEPTEQKIERVCKLLTTIGGKIEKSEGRSLLDKYFHQLIKMLHPPHTIIKSLEIKSEILDLHVLRSNNWIVKSYQTCRANEDRNRGGNQGGYGNRRQQQDNDGWSVQQNKSRNVPLNFSKLNIPSGTKLGNAADYQKFKLNSQNKFSGLPNNSAVAIHHQVAHVKQMLEDKESLYMIINYMEVSLTIQTSFLLLNKSLVNFNCSRLTVLTIPTSFATSQLSSLRIAVTKNLPLSSKKLVLRNFRSFFIDILTTNQKRNFNVFTHCRTLLFPGNICRVSLQQHIVKYK